MQGMHHKCRPIKEDNNKAFFSFFSQLFFHSDSLFSYRIMRQATLAISSTVTSIRHVETVKLGKPATLELKQHLVKLAVLKNVLIILAALLRTVAEYVHSLAIQVLRRPRSAHKVVHLAATVTARYADGPKVSP